jgi:hypothetical protein
MFQYPDDCAHDGGVVVGEDSGELELAVGCQDRETGKDGAAEASGLELQVCRAREEVEEVSEAGHAFRRVRRRLVAAEIHLAGSDIGKTVFWLGRSPERGRRHRAPVLERAQLGHIGGDVGQTVAVPQGQPAEPRSATTDGEPCHVVAGLEREVGESRASREQQLDGGVAVGDSDQLQRVEGRQRDGVRRVEAARADAKAAQRRRQLGTAYACGGTAARPVGYALGASSSSPSRQRAYARWQRGGSSPNRGSTWRSPSPAAWCAA